MKEEIKERERSDQHKKNSKAYTEQKNSINTTSTHTKARQNPSISSADFFCLSLEDGLCELFD